jgi:hypothetical protein
VLHYKSQIFYPAKVAARLRNKRYSMFKTNVGSIDRGLRIVVGLALLAGFFLNRRTYSWLYLIGIVPLATGLIRSCPLYSLLGLNTCPASK